MKPHVDSPPAPLTPLARRLRNGLFAALALLVGLNLFIHPHEPHFGLDAYPGFWALFGLVGAVALGRAAKGLAHTVLGRPEDYYEIREQGSGFGVQEQTGTEPPPSGGHGSGFSSATHGNVDPVSSLH
jgi:hypothetical protein